MRTLPAGILLVVLCLVAGLLIPAAAAPPPRREPARPEPAVGELCRDAIARVERQLGLPPSMLHAIALAESGRRDPDTKTLGAWPWTVNNGGDGTYSATKAEAIARVERLRREGKSNIDVGCMQINLGWHPDAFQDLDSAFDPLENVSYAGEYLQRLQSESGSWERAVERYHSRDSGRGVPYRERVMAHLARLRDAPAEILIATSSPPPPAEADLGTMRALNRVAARATWRWINPDLAIPSTMSPPIVIAGSAFVVATLEAAAAQQARQPRSRDPAAMPEPAAAPIVAAAVARATAQAATAQAAATAKRPASRGLPGRDVTPLPRPTVYAGPARMPGRIEGTFFVLPPRPGRPG